MNRKVVGGTFLGWINNAWNKLRSFELFKLFLLLFFIFYLISGPSYSADPSTIWLLKSALSPVNSINFIRPAQYGQGYMLSWEEASHGIASSSEVFLPPSTLLATSETTTVVSTRKFYRVMRVVDGDTLDIESIGQVRLIGVDTPELYHPLKPIQFYAREASEFVRKLVANSRVRIEYDREKVDKYGRTLVYVFLEDGRCLNEEIIKNGYGFAYTRFPFKNLLKYKKLEAEAKEKGLGLWANHGLDEFQWLLAQGAVPYQVWEMANNWWAIRYKNFVKLRLSAEELTGELLNLRQWTNEFSDRDLEKILLEKGWLKLNQ